MFLNATPLRKGGKLYMKVLVSHDCSTEELTAQTDWFHQEVKERFKKCVIQVPHTTNAGWLQYSLPYTDSDLLLLTHGLVSVKLLYGLCRYALSAFVPPSVIPNLQMNSWRGQAIKQICE
jgi:hypothetical protein